MRSPKKESWGRRLPGADRGGQERTRTKGCANGLHTICPETTTELVREAPDVGLAPTAFWHPPPKTSEGPFPPATALPSRMSLPLPQPPWLFFLKFREGWNRLAWGWRGTGWRGRVLQAALGARPTSGAIRLVCFSILRCTSTLRRQKLILPEAQVARTYGTEITQKPNVLMTVLKNNSDTMFVL